MVGTVHNKAMHLTRRCAPQVNARSLGGAMRDDGTTT